MNETIVLAALALACSGCSDAAEAVEVNVTFDGVTPTFEWAGGNVGEYGDTMTNPYQPRVLDNGRHANMHKAHTMGGYIRHTSDLTPISETRSIRILAYREGRWGRAGGISQVTYHDRSQSYEPRSG